MDGWPEAAAAAAAAAASIVNVYGARWASCRRCSSTGRGGMGDVERGTRTVVTIYTEMDWRREGLGWGLNMVTVLGLGYAPVQYVAKYFAGAPPRRLKTWL
ncbi:hypothetical protein ACLKA7_011317 [Drosophila subpalustris]